jgi:hypothetical protein
MNALELIEAIADQAGVTINIEEGWQEDLIKQYEVRLAIQPSWPFEHSITNVVGPATEQWTEQECPEHDGWLIGHAGCDVELIPSDSKLIYIAEGSQLGYLPGDVRSALGWSR